ncbi:universal stress protein [Ulvibacterium marinum]|uniref:Universal stress protein n=1 Tax=Ulvibacterium marinum TaxID=2419782 RepID=A0A3B0CFT1_9FLAO|nr:universal stress protein [Ulvibacterium marinum]RKN83009.1 universal stress protein [Ulvibacterium marinum]
MKKKQYKIVVLSDLTKSSATILKSAVSIAKMINGRIEVFSVKKPTDIVKMDNQLSAMRTINSEHKTINRKMRNLSDSLSEAYDIRITYSFEFGNVKNEIEEYLTDQKPDLVILGKRKSKTFGLMGDGVTDFILNRHSGAIMIVPHTKPLEPNKEVTLGMLNNPDPSNNLEFAEDLIHYAHKPLKSFKIVKNTSSPPKQPLSKDQKTIEYVFEYSDNIIKNFSTYLSKNNINLLCMDRLTKHSSTKSHLTTSDVKEVMGNLNVSLLISGK